MAGKPNTSLADLMPSRTGPRPVPTPAAAAQPEPQTVAPAVTETVPANRRRQPSRVKTVMIAGHFEADVSFAIHELIGKLTRQQGKRMTVQLALAEAWQLWFEKHEAIPPDGLKAALRD